MARLLAAAGSRLAGLWLLSLVILSLVPSEVRGGAWPAPKGEGQIILKADTYQADMAFNPAGQSEPLTDPVRLRTLDLWGEYGLSSTVTAEVQGRVSQGRIGAVDVKGLDTLRIGLRTSLLSPKAPLKVAAGLYREWPGRLGVSETLGVRSLSAVSEARILAGGTTRLRKHTLVAEIQLAERRGDDGVREQRQDLTLILSRNPRQQVITQVYSGKRHEPSGHVRWVTSEVTYLQACGRWRCQIGVRQTLDGRGTPKGQAFVLGLWARF